MFVYGGNLVLNWKLALIIPIGIAAIGLALWSTNARAGRKHEPVEYYKGWGGYVHPISLYNQITKDEADAIAAEGYAYLIGYYDDRGRLLRVTKMLRGAVFFDFEYAYHPNGKRKSARVTNAKGVVTVREYDEWGRGRADNPHFW